MKQTHAINGITVTIDWDYKGKLDSVDHSVYYAAFGEDEFGNQYEGTWHSCCGEDEVEDIECVTGEPVFVKSIFYEEACGHDIESTNESQKL